MNHHTFDVVIYGATSFVGQIVCRYMLQEFGTAAAPTARPLRWAIAGRSRQKLTAQRTALGPTAADLDILVADAADHEALALMCYQARVVASTVGPYALYGEPLVRACVIAGTDYCDLTGEAPWIQQMIARYGDDAVRSGARIVHACGFDSIPSDLGVYYLQQQAMVFTEHAMVE